MRLLPSVSLLLLSSSNVLGVALERRRGRTCVPDFEVGKVLNVFQAGRVDEAVEYLPPVRNASATSGGSFFLSETDTPENGGFCTSLDVNGTFRMSLASHDEGVQCLRSVGKNRGVTTGPCELLKATFTLSCTLCPSPSLSSASSNSTTPAPASYAGKACTITSLASPGYCLTTVPSSLAANETATTRGLGGLETRKCLGGRSREQSWDLRWA
ncbi:hypothetical protein JCM8547_007877 [Rhodosporidiobolus lusitaniae]